MLKDSDAKTPNQLSHSVDHSAGQSALLSVVIATRDGAETIAGAIQSAQGGNPSDMVEIVVVDDGSADGTRAAVRAMGAKGLTLVEIEHVGRSAARNVGARVASGTYLMFLDDDDVLAEGVISAFEELVTELGFPDVVRFGVRYLRNSQVGLRDVRIPTSDVLDGPFIPGTFIIKRELFEAIHGYDEEFDFAENTDLLVRACERVGTTVINRSEVGVDHLLRDDAATHYRQSRLDATLRFLDKHHTTLVSRPRVHSSYLGIAAHDLYEVGKTPEAVRFAWRSFTTWPRLKSALRIVRIAMLGPFKHRRRAS